MGVDGRTMLDRIVGYQAPLRTVVAETVTRLAARDFDQVIRRLANNNVELQLLEIAAVAARVQPGILGAAGGPRAACLNIRNAGVEAAVCQYHDAMALIPGITTQVAMRIAGIT